jgi:exosortase/archaeosortase family protein
MLTLAAIVVDQLAAPILYSSSPLWAVLACLLLIWRRGRIGLESEVGAAIFDLSFARTALFAAAHVVLIFTARVLHGTLELIPDPVSFAGWTKAALKLSVLLPTVLLQPLAQWRILARVYAAEGVAALVVLFTFFPQRIFATVWPWYAQVLGKVVFYFSRFFVQGLSYSNSVNPTVHGPDVDVTIVFACSGISGIELFDCLFAFVVLLDWNRVHKGRVLVAYVAGIAAMCLANALRIASFVIFGNRGAAGIVVGFHLSAGWVFFFAVFFTYLLLTYRTLIVKN